MNKKESLGSLSKGSLFLGKKKDAIISPQRVLLHEVFQHILPNLVLGSIKGKDDYLIHQTLAA